MSKISQAIDYLENVLTNSGMIQMPPGEREMIRKAREELVAFTKVRDALLKYQEWNRMHTDSEAELWEAGNDALMELEDDSQR